MAKSRSNQPVTLEDLTRLRSMIGQPGAARQRLQAPSNIGNGENGASTQEETAARGERIFANAANIAQKNLQTNQALAAEAKENKTKLAESARQFDQSTELRRQQGTLDYQRQKADYNLKERTLEQSDRNDRARIGLEAVQESKRFSDQEIVDVKSADMMNADATEMLRAARSLKFTPEGRRVYSQLSAEARAIQGQKGSMRPAQFSQMMSQWMDRFESADLSSFVAQPPTIDEEFSKVFKDVGNGVGLLRQPDGTYDRISTVDPGFGKYAEVKAKEAQFAAEFNKETGERIVLTPQQRAEKLWRGMENRDAYNKERKEAEATLQQRYAMENPDATGQKEFSAKEIHAEMMRGLESQYEFEQSLMGGSAPAGVDPSRPSRDLLRPAGHTGDRPIPDAGPAFAPSGMGVDPSRPSRDLLRPAGHTDRQALGEPRVSMAEPMDRPKLAAPPMTGEMSQAPPTDTVSPVQDNTPEARIQRREVAMGEQRQGIAGYVQSHPESEAFKSLADGIRMAGWDMDPASLIQPSAVAMLQASGSESPIEDAAKAVYWAMAKGTPHFSLLSKMEQDMLRAERVMVYDENTKEGKAAIEKLSPGDHYLDPAHNILRVPPAKQKVPAGAGDNTGFLENMHRFPRTGY